MSYVQNFKMFNKRLMYKNFKIFNKRLMYKNFKMFNKRLMHKNTFLCYLTKLLNSKFM